MKIHVLVRDECEWVKFFTVKWQAYQYMWALKNTLYSHYHRVKSYARNGRNFIKSEYYEGAEIQSEVYSIWEISIVDALNWMASDRKADFVKDWIINGSEYQPE